MFGDGHEYDWALVGDEDMEEDEEQYKPDMRYQDVSASYVSSGALDHLRSQSGL